MSEENSTQKKWDDGKMRDQIGIACDVERDKEGGDVMKRANRALNDIGDFVHQAVPEIQQLDYVGSAAVHIYLAPTLGQVVYVSQTQPLLDCHERLAGPAFTDLQKSMMAHFGRKTTKIRSGF
jgi:hypothetical protein